MMSRRLASVDQRKQRRVAQVAAVPIVLAVDLDGLAVQRQARAGEHARGIDLLVGEHPDLAGPHIGGAQVKLDRTAAAQAVEIDHLLEQGPQRIVVPGIELIGREHAGHEVEEDVDGGMLEPMVAGGPVVPRGLQTAPLCQARDPLPEVRERGRRARAPTDGETVGEHDRVHSAGTGRADAVDLEPRLLHEPVEHAPGEGAMGAAALQREIGELGFRHHRQPSELRGTVHAIRCIRQDRTRRSFRPVSLPCIGSTPSLRPALTASRRDMR